MIFERATPERATTEPRQAARSLPAIDRPCMGRAVRGALPAIGEDPPRHGLAETKRPASTHFARTLHEQVGAVVEHMCLKMRGVVKLQGLMLSSAFRGCIKRDCAARAEVFTLLKT